MRPAYLILCLPLAACSTGAAAPVPAKHIKPPSDELMTRPKALADIKAGDSIYDHAATCRAEYGRLADKVEALQNISTVITGKKARPAP